MKKKHTFSKALCAAVLLSVPVLGSTQYANAQTRGDATVTTDVPRTISYQGLINSGDKPVPDGKHSFTFTLYGDDSRQNVVWSGTYFLETKDGVVSALLGSGNSPLPGAIDMNKPLWLGVRVDSAPTEAAMNQLSSAAYALNVSDNSITASKLANQAVTAEKMGTDYVASISVDGRPIKGVGTELNFKSGPGLEVKYNHVTNSIELKNTATNSEPKGPKVQWTGYNPGLHPNDDGTGNTTPDLTNVIGGGWDNSANPYGPAGGTNGFASVVGGHNNNASGLESAIPGGAYLKVGSGSFGFNHQPSGTTVVQANSIGNNLAYLGNVDLAIGNTDNTEHDARFYVRNTSATFAGAKYVGMKAPSTLAGSSFDYTLPDAPSAAGKYLTSTTGGVLSWGTPSVGSVDWANINNPSALPNTSGATFQIGNATTLSPTGTGIIVANQIQDAAGTALQPNRVVFGDPVVGMIAQDANFNYTAASGLSLNTVDATVTDAKLRIANSGTGFTSTFKQATSGGANMDYVLPVTVPSTGDVLSVTGVVGSTVTTDWSAAGSTTNKWTKGGDNITSGSGLLGTDGTSTVDLSLESKGTTLLAFDGTNSNILGGTGSAITGGTSNIIAGGTVNTIVGGNSNTISGGDNNVTGTLPATTAKFVTISGGSGNVAHANSSTIGGGVSNTINSAGLNPGGFNNNGFMATIPGGETLVANSYAQTVVGKFNLDNQPTVAVGGANTNAPLFVVGNGTAAGARANAFEVSYNGHATPKQILGNAAVAGPVLGGRYNDNSINAWGDVTAAGVVTNDFAVVGVVFAAPNVYTVTLNYLPAGGAVSTLTNAAITATIHENACGVGGPGFCTVTQLNDCALGANVFQVRTYGPAGGPAPLPFFFHVSGR